MDVENLSKEDVEDKLNNAFDGKKIKVDFYTKEDGQNRIMKLEVVE